MDIGKIRVELLLAACDLSKIGDTLKLSGDTALAKAVRTVEERIDGIKEMIDKDSE